MSETDASLDTNVATFDGPEPPNLSGRARVYITKGVEPPSDGGGIETGRARGGSDDGVQSVGDEAYVVGTITKRQRERRVVAAQQIVRDLAPPPKPTTAIVDATPDPDDALADDLASPARDARPPSGAASSGMLGSVVKDIGRGLIETPRQIAGGARDALQAAIDLGDWVADKAEEIAPLGGVQLFNDKGELAPAYLRPGDPRLAAEKTGGQLPTIRDAKTVTGGLVRGVSQFLTSFLSAGGVMGNAVKSVPAARASIQGALANFVGFDPLAKRLSDLVEEYPALSNPVTTYLQSNPDDGQAEGRLKNALEGLGLGVMTEGLFKGIRYIRDAKRAGIDVDAQAAARERAAPRQAQPMTLLGDEAAPLLQGSKIKSPDFGVPDDIVAKAVVHDARGLPPLPKGAVVTGSGANGPIVSGLEGRWSDAVSWLRNAKTGDAVGVLSHPDVPGRIDVIWGNEAGGLAHILRDHPNVANDLPRLIADMRVRSASANRINLESDQARAGVRLDYDGESKSWLVTAFRKGDPDGRSGLRPAADLRSELSPHYGSEGAGSATNVSSLADGVSINFSRIESADDIKAVLRTTAEAFKDDIDAARRGVRSNAETLAAADGENAWTALMDRRAGAPMNAEQSVAARRLWEASAAKLLQVADAAVVAPSPENLFQFRRMMAIHNTVQQEVIAARTETARALQSWRIPVGGGAEQLRAIENVLASNGGADVSAELAAKIAALGRVPDGLPALADVVEKGALARTIDAVKEVWINALLSNPKTHIVNTIGNAAGMAVEMVERATAGAYSAAIGSGAVRPGEAAEKFFAMRQGVREGFRLFNKALRSGESSFGVETTKVADAGLTKAISADALKLKPDDWMGRAVDTLGAVVNVPTRLLGAEDDFFKAVAYRMEVNALAFRHASQEVVDGKIAADGLKARVAEIIANPPENVRLSGVDYSAYQTFTSSPGSLVQAINGLERQMMRGAGGEQISSLALRMLIPFRNTPANLVKYSFERTPLAPLMSRYREAIARGGADADIARARMSLGTMSMLAVMDFALDGVITGGGPRGDQNKGNLQTLQRTGWQPYSIKIGDRYFSYRRTDPIGLFMGTAADIAEIVSNATVDEDKRESVLAASGMAAASFGNLVLDKTYMSTISATIDVLHNPDKSPTFFQQRFAAFVPAVSGEARRQTDPYMRYTADFVDELKNRTPGLSASLPMSRDMWGRPRSYQSGLGQAYDALSPIASRLEKPEPIDREAIANDFNLAMPGWTMSFGKGVSVALRNRPEAYSRFLELRGQEKPSAMGESSASKLLIRKYGDKPLLDVLNDMVEGRAGQLSENYAAAGGGRNGGKDDLVSKIVADYGRAAKAQLLVEFDETAGVVSRKAAKRASSR